MKYSSISIKKFRAIDEMRMDNLKQINLITGRNNCGKTTILEALFLISGMSNPQLPVTINNIRDLILASDDSFNSIFHNLDFKQEPYISAVLDGKKRNLNIKPNYAIQYENKVFNVEGKNLVVENKATINDDFPVVKGIFLEFNDGKSKENFTSEISLSGNTARVSNRYKERLNCSFHAQKNYMAVLPQRMEKLFVNKQMSGIINALCEIDPKIIDIRMGFGGMIYTDVGLDKLFPINIMGDGIRRILSILAAISDMQGGILLIDEIENGLHYSTLKTLWKTLLKALEEYHVQLFATTHSSECIAALNSSCKETDYDSDNIRLYRIEKQENNHRAFEYTPEMITAGIDDCIEMR